ncbi:MAG: hypothetical protein AAFZ18_30170 [Myxococcota bacterium]
MAVETSGDDQNEWAAAESENLRAIAKVISEFLDQVAGAVGHTNAKSEDRVGEIQRKLGELSAALTEDPTSAAERVADLQSLMQFQDIQRQELEQVEGGLRGVAEVGSSVRAALSSPSLR